MNPKEYLNMLVEGINSYPYKREYKEIYGQLQKELITVAGAFMRCNLITTAEQINYLKMAKVV